MIEECSTFLSYFVSMVTTFELINHCYILNFLSLEILNCSFFKFSLKLLWWKELIKIYLFKEGFWQILLV